MAEKQQYLPHPGYYPPYQAFTYYYPYAYPHYNQQAHFQSPSYCTSEHEGKDIGLTHAQQHHHHTTGHHHHYPQAAPPPAVPTPAYQPVHTHYHPPPQPYPQHPHHHGHFHHHPHPPYPATPPVQPPRSPVQDEFWYVPPGQVPAAEGRGKNLWHGRSRAEVEEDERRAAYMTGAYDPKDIKPHDPKPDDMFVVVYPDGSQMHVSYATIEGAEWKGRWTRDEHGRMVFYLA